MKSLLDNFHISKLTEDELFSVKNFLKSNFDFKQSFYSGIDDKVINVYKPIFKKSYLKNNNSVLIPFIQDWDEIDFLSKLLDYYKKLKVINKVYVCNTQILYQENIDRGFSINFKFNNNGLNLKDEAKFRYDYTIICPDNFSFSVILDNDDDFLFAINRNEILKIASNDELKSYYNILDFKSKDLYLSLYQNFCNCDYYKDFYLYK